MTVSERQLSPKRQLSRKRDSHRGRSWRISVALFACFGVSIAALHTILQGFDWWFASAGVAAAVLGSAAIARALSARPWLPTLVGVLAIAGTTTLFFARGTVFLFIVPTPASIGVFSSLAQEGGTSIASQSVPAEATAGIVFLLCVGAGLLAVVGDFIAVTWRRPALAAVPLAVILGIPTVIGIHRADVFMIVLAAACWLVLLRAGQPFPQTARALGLGSLALVTALVLPLVLPQVDESHAGRGGLGGYLANVNPVLALGEELRRDLPRTILTYSNYSRDPTYLRLVSLKNFLPDTWEPDPPAIDPSNTPQKVGDPPGLATAVTTESENTWVTVENLGSTWLPVPYPATMVSGLRGDWFWDAEDLTFSNPDGAARGEEYRASSLIVQPTPAQLAAALSAVPDSQGGADDSYLSVPDDLPAIIGDTAREVTAAATSDYGRAVALQEYFRGGTFEYSETAPVDNGYDANGMIAIAQFLEAKSGYCIHFASAMAVMARTLGIPSRVTVGFLPGEKQSNTVVGRTVFRVTTDDVHAWPELYFDGVGWMRFEPTASRGFVPQYADEATPGVPIAPGVTPTETAEPSPTATPSRSAAPLDPESQAAGSDSAAASLVWLWVLLVVLGIALLLLIPAGVRTGQRIIRFRRLARGSPAATTGWKELLQSVHDLGVDISATATPREAASMIAVAATLDDADRRALWSVLNVVERQSFGGEPSTPVGGILTARTTADGEAAARDIGRVLDRLRSVSRWRTRVAAVLVPRSIWLPSAVSREG